MHRVAYERVLPIDNRRLWMWTAVHALHGWSQAIGAGSGAFPMATPATRPPTESRQSSSTNSVADSLSQ
jgi:hypothetical protein